MATVRVKSLCAGTVHHAEQCWYDTARWPDWVDELARVVSVEGPWPEVGGAVVWESGPAGRGQVRERVIAYQPLEGQTVEVEDEAMAARQRVEFLPEGEEVEIVLELQYQLKRSNPLTRAIDVLFVRRLMGASLSRTLSRFGAVLAASRQAPAG